LRTLYLTQFLAVRSRRKSLVLLELKTYSDRKRRLSEKEMALRLKFNRKAFAKCIIALKNNAVARKTLRRVQRQTQTSVKAKVLQAMRQVCRKSLNTNIRCQQLMTTHYKTLCTQMLIDWRNLMHSRIDSRASLLERQQKFQVRRFFGKLRLLTELGHVMRAVDEKLKSFRSTRLMYKSLRSLQSYVKSASCIAERKARKLRVKLLKSRAISALKRIAYLGSRHRFFRARHHVLMKKQVLARWISSLDRIENYRQIFIALASSVKSRVFRVLKAHWARRQIKRA